MEIDLQRYLKPSGEDAAPLILLINQIGRAHV